MKIFNRNFPTFFSLLTNQTSMQKKRKFHIVNSQQKQHKKASGKLSSHIVLETTSKKKCRVFHVSCIAFQVSFSMTFFTHFPPLFDFFLLFCVINENEIEKAENRAENLQ